MSHRRERKTLIRVGVRIKKEDDDLLKNLVSTGTYSSKSDVLRVAVSEFTAKYTNRPTLLNLDRQVKTVTARLDKYDESMREIRRKLAEFEELIERLKKLYEPS